MHGDPLHLISDKEIQKMNNENITHSFIQFNTTQENCNHKFITTKLVLSQISSRHRDHSKKIRE
jgi:hypothetical protein